MEACMKGRSENRILSLVPARFYWIRLGESWREPTDVNWIAMSSKVSFHSPLFLVVCCSIHEENHVWIFSMEFFEVWEESITISTVILTKKLSAIFSQCAEHRCSAMRSRCEHKWFAAFHSPDPSKNGVIYKYTLVNYYKHSVDCLTRQIPLVFFMNNVLSASFE